MKKDDLCTGDIVTMKNGEKYTIMLGVREIVDCMVSCENIKEWCLLERYNQNLKCDYEKFDIVKIEKPTHIYASMGIDNYQNTDVKTIWEREEVKKMTIKEIQKVIQKELGYKVEIVE